MEFIKEFLRLVTGLTVASVLFAGLGAAIAMWSHAQQKSTHEPFSIAIIADE